MNDASVAADSDSARLVGLAVRTAVQLLEEQDGLLYPIAHAVEPSGRTAFVGVYCGGASLQPIQALEALRDTLRATPYRSTAVVFGVALAHESGRSALCIEFESLDAAPETILVPFVITRPWLRQARVITYAPIRQPGREHVLRHGPGLGKPTELPTRTRATERTPLGEKE